MGPPFFFRGHITSAPLARVVMGDVGREREKCPFMLRRQLDKLRGSTETRTSPEYVVGDAVPGVVNSDKKQQQRRRSNAKQGLARVSGSRDCREREHRIRGQRQYKMKQPVFELWLVYRLGSHAPGHDCRIRHSTEAGKSPKSCDEADRLPWGAQKC